MPMSTSVQAGCIRWRSPARGQRHGAFCHKFFHRARFDRRIREARLFRIFPPVKALLSLQLPHFTLPLRELRNHHLKSLQYSVFEKRERAHLMPAVPIAEEHSWLSLAHFTTIKRHNEFSNLLSPGAIRFVLSDLTTWKLGTQTRMIRLVCMAHGMQTDGVFQGRDIFATRNSEPEVVMIFGCEPIQVDSHCTPDCPLKSNRLSFLLFNDKIFLSLRQVLHTLHLCRSGTVGSAIFDRP